MSPMDCEPAKSIPEGIPSSSNHVDPGVDSSSGAPSVTDLRKILSEIYQEKPRLSLASFLGSNVITKLVSKYPEDCKRLYEFLPEDHPKNDYTLLQGEYLFLS
eukprot:Sdes_comp19819_c0_seq5m11973